MTKPILVFGTVVIDRVRRIEKMPSPGQYGEFTDEQLFLGGEAANTAVALRKWGNAVLLLGNGLGESTESDWLREELAHHGLSSEHCEPGPGPAPCCDIYLTPDGCRTMFGQGWGPGPVALPDVDADWLTVDPNRFAKGIAISRSAQERGIRRYVMDYGVEDIPLCAGDVLQRSSRSLGPDASLDREALVAEVSRGAGGTAILTQGSSGIIIGVDGHTVRAPGFVAHPVVDTTGAGDCFRAGMLHGLNQGWELGETVAFAAAAASLKCEAEGATTGIPALEAVQNRLREQAKISQEIQDSLRLG